MPLTRIAFTIFLALPCVLTVPALAGVDAWSRQGPHEDDVLALAIDPVTPSTLYAGTARHGVFKSTDAGGSWRATMGSFPPEGVRALLIDDAAPSTVYAGTELDGVFRTTDGGETWERVNDGLTDLFVVALAGGPAAIYAATEIAGIFRSTDGGESWSAVNQGLTDLRILALANAPSTPSTLYAATLSGIFESTDGETWSPGLAFPATVLAIAQGDPAVLYAGTDPARTGEEGLWTSTDGGLFWTSRTDALPAPGAIEALAVDPSDPSILYLALAGRIWKSTDGARTWSATPLTVVDGVLAIVPQAPTIVYAGGRDAGVWKTVDGGARWFPRSDGLGYAAVGTLAAGPEATVLYAATPAGNVYRSTNRGQTWVPVTPPDPFQAIAAMAVDPSTTSTVYASVAGGEVWKSTDRAITWAPASAGLPAAESVSILAIDPSTPSTIYAATSVGVYRSLDGAASWRNAGAGLPDASIHDLAVDPETPGEVYAATARGLFVTVDGGDAWTSLELPFPEPPIVRLVVVDPRTPSILYAQVEDRRRGGLWKSTDGGASWSKTGSDRAQVRAVVIDPTTPSVLYLGTAKRVFRSTDGGATWSPYSEGLAFSGGLHDLAITTYPPKVFAATQQGVFDIRPARGTTTLHLHDGRFEVEVDWRDGRGATGSGKVAVVDAGTIGGTPLASRDSTVVQFFGPRNWEMLLKVLDGTRVNGYHWVFLAAATDVGYSVTVFDTVCGGVRTYRNFPGVTSPAVTDVEVFRDCDDPKPASCAAESGSICLGPDGRFRASVRWTDFEGESSTARQVRLAEPGLAVSDDSGLFYFFSENNWELLVKVLDGCPLNGRYWVFGAATTDVEYVLRVTDTLTGVVRTYRNPLGLASPAITDTQAFATCP